MSYSIENPRSRIESNVVGALNLLELQKGYLPAIWAETQLLSRLTGYVPKTDLRDSVVNFVKWLRD